MNLSFLYHSRKGVSMLEYMTLITLVMTGIIVGGPYMMRSVNAPFKAMEDGALDSAREDLRQGPTGLPLPPCACTALADSGCGDGVSCARTKKLFKRSCIPLGCEADLIATGVLVPPIMEECRDDPTNSCCTPSVATGNCGVLAVNVPGGCLTGQMERSALCGSPTSVTVYTCAPDPMCSNSCQPLGTNASWCPGHLAGVTGLTPVTYVENGHCNDSSDMRCKAQCDPGTIVSAGGCLPRCGNGVCEDGLDGRPDFDEDNTNCPVDCALSTGGWVNNYFPSGQGCPHVRLPCREVCAKSGLNFNADPVSKKSCASGENRPNGGVGAASILYYNGSWGDGNPGIPTYEEMGDNQDIFCWHTAGQKKDWDPSDVSVACYCGTAPAIGSVGPRCGNAYCDDYDYDGDTQPDCESWSTCPADCPPPPPSVCPNGVCEWDENNTTCAADCYCGNGRCEPTENLSTCYVDCFIDPCGGGCGT